MQEIKYESICVVLGIWDQARFSDKHFDETFGMKVLNKLFDLEPRAKDVFGFHKGKQDGDATVERHAKAFSGFFDLVFQMLGPDFDFMEQMLVQVGARHRKLGVDTAFFGPMGQAISLTIESYLDRPFEAEEKAAWDDMYAVVSGGIIREINKKKLEV